jgi:protein-S-isoprenylcysteine O-methyltransferase Ste14
MIESIAVTLPPAIFLAILFGGGALFRRKSIDQDGEPPIDHRLFYASKYAIPALWAVMVLDAWGINLSFVRSEGFVKWTALVLWFLGFSFMFAGRFGLGASFRMGSARERTSLKTDGLYRLSRNPMYVGVYSTLSASALYTLNPMVLAAAIFVAVVHHRIILAEEEYLGRAFGKEYTDYCLRVRRYL